MPYTICKPLILLTLLLSGSAAFAQGTDCSTDDYLEAAIAHLESHYRSFPEEMFSVQLYLREGFDQQGIKPDGKWGPKTESAVCGVLRTYTKIGGADGDWGIHRASHGTQFTDWVRKAARANLSEGEIEFPD